MVDMTCMKIFKCKNEEDTKKESAPFFIINNLINKKLIGLIKDIGNLANKAYSRGLRDEYYDS